MIKTVKRKNNKISPKAKKYYIGIVVFLVLFYLTSLVWQRIEDVRFAKEAEVIFNQSGQVWRAGDFIKENGVYLDKDEAFYRKMLSECNSDISKIKKLLAPKDAKLLKNKILEYYLLGQSLSNNSLWVSDYTRKIEQINKDLSLTKTSGTNPIGDLTKWKTMINKDIESLENTKPTPAFREMNTGLIKILKELSAKLDNLIKAINERDTAKIKTATADLHALDTNISVPNSEEILNDIATLEDLRHMADLENQITQKIQILKQ